MSELTDLYQEVILDHHRHPRNFKALPDADRQALGHNPLCGDQLIVFVKLAGDVIVDVAFQGQGCAISRASASMMTAAVKGLPRAQADALFEKFHQLVTGQKELGHPEIELGKLAAFGGVCEFPVRVKCASLPWHTLRAALESTAKPISTE
ncbi:MAG: SUF system NifU family Fe-S cluster assembly protein [Planctomycetes bacterium]|nr:SUF system NifU family Fe-S cluster assembly protein [Planctomycetota bacterium]